VKVHGLAEVTSIVRSTVHEIISDLNFLKCLLPGFWKCSPMSTKAKEWLLRLKTFTVTKMKENNLWIASLQKLRHGFTSSSKSQKETSWLANILIHLPQKKRKRKNEKPQLNHSKKKKQWQSCSGIVEASCCVNFSHKNNNQLWHYCETLEKLHETIKWIRPGWLTARMWLLHDVAWPRTSAQTVAWLQKRQEGSSAASTTQYWSNILRFLPLQDI
jgi:hypothetical protein